MTDRRTTKQVSKSVQELQETPKAELVHKVIQGEFERRIEAIQAVKKVKERGFPVGLIIESGKYELLFAEGISKREAEEVVKNLAAAGIRSKIV